VADSLEFLAGSDLATFNSLVGFVPQLYELAKTEIRGIEPSVKSGEAYIHWSSAYHLLLTAAM